MAAAAATAANATAAAAASVLLVPLVLPTGLVSEDPIIGLIIGKPRSSGHTYSPMRECDARSMVPQEYDEGRLKGSAEHHRLLLLALVLMLLLAMLPVPVLVPVPRSSWTAVSASSSTLALTP